MCDDRGGQEGERVDLAQLTRPGDRQEAFNGPFTVGAARAEHDLPPLHGRPEGALGGIVGGLDAVFVHEGKEMLVVHEERLRQIADVGVRGIKIPLAEGKKPLLNRQRPSRSIARESGAHRARRVAPKPMPQAKQPTIEHERLPAEPFGRRRGGEIERTEDVSCHVRPTKLPLTDDVFQIGGQAVTAQDAGERVAENGRQHVGAPRRGNAIDHKRRATKAQSQRLSPFVRWPVSSAFSTASCRNAA